MASTPAYVNLVGNYFRAGPAGPVDGNFWNEVVLSTTLTYDNGNYWDPSPNDALSKVPGIKPVKADRIDSPVATEWAMPAVTTYRSDSVYNRVLNSAGAWPRDPMNTRTVNDVRTRTGTLRNVSDALITSGPAAPADADNDGMPDAWETLAGLSPNDATDAAKDRNGDGYTNIEDYINCLADSLLGHPCPPPQAVEAVKNARPAGLKLLLGPNPFFGSRVNMSIEGIFPATGMARILDVSGKTVAKFRAAERMAWDGCDPAGAKTAPGVYTMRLEDKGKLLASKKIMLAR
jgi:hypothetical protein